MNQLQQHNERLTQSLIAHHQKLVADRNLRNATRLEHPSPLAQLKFDIAAVLRQDLGPAGEPEIQVIDRQKFGGDLVLKFPKLLAQGGPKVFNEKYRDRILNLMKEKFGRDVMADIITKGMYLNLTLADPWLVKAASFVAHSSEDFGYTRDLAHDAVVIDYSSPNVAKTLHAGHIRSTIIGHVLGNVLEAAGAAVYRVNHINDFGGFGFLLEGYRRFAAQFPSGLKDHEKLTEIYHVRRTLERILAGKLDLTGLDETESARAQRYFPNAKSAADFAAIDAEFTKKSDARFAALESGHAIEVELWAQMVRWSMTDFGSFYKSLNLEIPLVIGESYYFEPADQLIDRLIEDGRAAVYTQALADRDQAALATTDLSEAEREKAVEGITKDIGATVISFTPDRRLVVRRKDGLSIYATRDVGAVKRRMELFDATKMIYVTGQEQKEHFARVFEAARLVGLCPETVELLHLYFGFYVDSKTGKKLSSRASAAGVMDLLKGSFDYFKNKLGEDVPAEDLDHTAQQLTVGSIVFNELKQDIRGAVEIDPMNLRATIEGFEKSGGAYVVYATCRARSILRKVAAQGLSEPAGAIDAAPNAEETGLILKALEIPERVTAAARQSNPVLLVRHLDELAHAYSAYYTKARVIEDGKVHPFRWLMTKAVMVGLMRGLAICHIECPARI